MVYLLLSIVININIIMIYIIPVFCQNTDIIMHNTSLIDTKYILYILVNHNII